MKRYLKTFVVKCLISVLMALPSVAAHAWGYEGHRIAADVAAGLLTQEARIRVGELLKGGSLADVASYLDEERKNLMYQLPGSDKWHFDNIPVCRYATIASVCPHGDCATARIDQLSQLLADRQTDRATRVFALKALVHLIADIHQPLHAANNDDHGGNDVSIGSRSLHKEWDSGLVKRLIRKKSADDYAAGLLARYENELRIAQSGNATAWANESHELAVRVAYGALPGFACGGEPLSFDRLPASYYDNALPIVESQLVKAGARIAFVLNQALSR